MVSNLNRKVEQLEHILNQGGADFCPHLPYVVREFRQAADGTRAEIKSEITERYAPAPIVPNDTVCACGRPRVEVHLVEVDGPFGHSEALQ